jgi:serine O-acetyltransferase
MPVVSTNTGLQHAALDAMECSLRPVERRHLGAALAGCLDRAVGLLHEDLDAYASRDPASHGDPGLILETYATFQAVICYRLAQQLWKLIPEFGPVCELVSQRLSNRGKVLSGVEVHPAATIGRRFVLDHGFGTVIGETCEIGNDCYILSGVTLGATGIANNRNGKRHPRLGNGVEIGSAARVLGPVVIGDDVFISPSCVITQDVPAHARVRIANQVQVLKLQGATRCGYFSAFASNLHLHLVGESVESQDVEVLDSGHERVASLRLERTDSTRHHAQFRLLHGGGPLPPPGLPLHLRVACPDHQVTVLEPPGLGGLVRGVVDKNALSALD